MVDGVLAVDSTGRFTLVNTSVEAMFGTRRGEMLGTTIWEQAPKIQGRVCHPDGRPFDVDDLPLRRALRGEIVRDCEKMMVNQSTGRRVHARVNASPVRGPSGETLGAVEVIR